MTTRRADAADRRPDPGRGPRARPRGRAPAGPGDRDVRAIVAERVPAAAGACRASGIEGFASSSRPTRRSSPRSCGCARASCWRRSRPRPGGVGVRELRVHVRRGGSPRIIRGTCQPSRGDTSRSNRARRSSTASRTDQRARRPREARMAVRLQMKLGVVAEHERLPDSPDTLSSSSRASGSVAARRATCTCSSRRAIARATRSRRRASSPRRSGASTTTTSRPASGSASRRRSRPRTSGSPTRPTGSA